MATRHFYLFIICNDGEFMIRPFINNTVHKDKYFGQILRDVDYKQVYNPDKIYKFEIYGLISYLSYREICNLIIENLKTPHLISGVRKIDTLENYIVKSSHRYTISNSSTTISFAEQVYGGKSYICCPILNITNRAIY